MHRRRRFLKTASAIGLGSLAGCVGGLGGSSGPIKIGFNAPLTGFASADGKSARQGAKLAEELINENGGVNDRDVEVLVEDDAAAQDEAVPIAQEFINSDNVDVGVSGSYSSPTRAIAPIYNQNGVPFISGYATHPDITNGEYTFRVGIWAPIHGKAGAMIAEDRLDAQSAALFRLNNDFGTTISDAFKQAAQQRGIDIVYETTYPVGESNFRSALNSVKEAGPDLLYATGYYHEAANIVKQADEIGVEAQIMGEEGYDSPQFFELGGQATNGTIITTNLNRGSEREATTTFLSEYQSRWEVRADMVAANCYDGVQLAARAISDAGSTDADEVVSAIESLENWEGAATGPIRDFIGPGEAVRPISVQEVQNMEWTEYMVITDDQIIRPNV